MEKFLGWFAIYLGLTGLALEWLVNPALFAYNYPTISVAGELAKTHGVLGVLFGLALPPFLVFYGITVLSDERKRGV